jgi:predicted dehydrogenase
MTTLFSLAYLPGISSVKEYTDHKEMLEKEKEIEWVLIGSKNCLHRDHCVDSFKVTHCFTF